MSTPKQLENIESLYTENIRTKGETSTAVGWNTAECQELRFDKLSSYIEDDNYSVNDYGCGFGSHLLYLTETLGHKVNAYNGYDISQDMLDAAEKKLSSYEGKLSLIKSPEINTDADYGFVSGTFNVKFDAPKADWEEFITNTLNALSAHSQKGFSFNMLTSYVDWEEDHLYYGDPKYWFDFCKINFSKKVNILHDYDLWEWTIVVKKD
ncbi:MAG: class I SAM-dependent methyltransferase [Alphaproteobacteria bacterium]|nr:class I SAM-dependent methyltransferase [Alphaproteobacteria bacterium]